MALMRRSSSQRFAVTIWPGFVDALSVLLLVMIFVLTIFMVVQSALRNTINEQGTQLEALNAQIAGLANALALGDAKVADLTGQLASAQGRISAFEAQVAALMGERDGLRGELDTARRDAAAKAGADAASLAALTLELEAQRKKAEETLTLLAAAQAARADLEKTRDTALTEAERQAGLLAAAQAALSKEKDLSGEAQKQVELLNQQMVALRDQLAQLQAVLDASAARDSAAKVQVEALGTQLNSALAQVASEQKKRAELEAAERKRLEEETKQLARYRSEFFGRMSEVLAGREGVRVVGDRFVFSSEVLFNPGSDVLAEEGRSQIGRVAQTLAELADEIPPEIDWIIRVDGHTDNLPLSGGGRFSDNWQLSQARALSVVRFMIDELGFNPKHLAATGFGEFHPVNDGTNPEDRAQNRRIELKLTER